MVRWGARAVALGWAAFANDVSADTNTLARAGSWEAFGGTTTNGRGVCGISAEISKRYFGLKYFAGNPTFTIQIGTPEWTVTKGEKIGVTMLLDNNPPWHANGTAFVFEDGDAGLQFTVKRDELDNFTREFRSSSLLKVRFEDGRFRDWTMGLEGTLVVNGAFQNCVKGLK